MAKGPIEQLVLNLAINARDALSGSRPDGSADPRISVAVRSHFGAAPEDPAGTHREWVVIEVVDNGVGMAPEVLARAREPFFTTKAADRGTGLGLSVVTDIAASLDGWAEICSAPGEGTAVRVGLPVQESGGRGER